MSARWMRANVARFAGTRSSSSSSGKERQSWRAVRSSSRIRSRSSGAWPSRSLQAFSASPMTPTVSGCLVHRERRRHRQVLVDPGECHRLREGAPADRPRRLERSLAVRDPVRVAREHHPKLALVEARELRRAEGDQQRARLAAVRVIRGVQDLFGRDLVVEAQQVDGAPDGGVEEDPGLASKATGEP